MGVDRCPLLPEDHVTWHVQKPQLWFGYLPVRSEFLPLLPQSGNVDWTRVLQNIVAGCVIGIRQTLSAIVSATLVFTGANVPEITDMFHFGISMMWYSTMAGSAFYGIFGRLQYNTNATQEVCSILYSSMAGKAAAMLADQPEKIPPTVIAIIMASTVMTGVAVVGFGQLGLGKVMLRFPAPVSNGFLGTIGFFLVKTALQVASGVPFRFFYPRDIHGFFSAKSMGPVTCLLLMVAFARKAPGMLKATFPKSIFIKKMAALMCQLFPLVIFYAVVLILNIGWDELSEADWTYPSEASQSFSALWTTYSIWDADGWVLLDLAPNVISLVMMTVLCTMTGAVGIVGSFPAGPDGDPMPYDSIDYDKELSTVGLAAVLVGLTNGVVTFHRLGSSIQLRLDGGTHRIGVLSSAAFVGVFFFSSIPLGHYIPKWFLGGLFMGSGLGMLENAVLSYHSLRIGEFCVTMICILVAVFSSPFAGIGAGLTLSAALFLLESSNTSPVSSMSTGESTVSRTCRPAWELRILQEQGDCIVILYLQGAIFFGSGINLTEVLSEATELDQIKYCILSFGKVPSVDASAAEQLKFAVKRARESFGCTVIFCRMDKPVFEALSLAGVIKSPDNDLRTVIEFEEKEEVAEGHPHQSPQEEGLMALDVSPIRSSTPPRSGRAVSIFRPLGSADHDAFDHETDALDFCADKILAEFCYAGPQLQVMEQYKLDYREACNTGCRLNESACEAVAGFPQGLLARLKPFVTVETGLASGQELEGGSMYLVLQGAITFIDCLAEDTKLHQLATSLSRLRVKGFTGRGGQKRLRKRYPPGSIVGKVFFYIPSDDVMIGTPMRHHLVVSSKFGYSTEVWKLTKESWSSLPASMQQAINEVVAMQFAHERQHTLMSGE